MGTLQIVILLKFRFFNFEIEKTAEGCSTNSIFENFKKLSNH